MVFEALRGYVQGATGLTEMTTSKARAVVRDLLASGETGLSQMSDQVDKLAKELITTSKANRKELEEIIKAEVNRLLGALDLARTEEVDRLRDRVEELESNLLAVRKAAKKTAGARSRTETETAPAEKATVTRGRTPGKAGRAEKTVARGASAKASAEKSGKAAEATSDVGSDTVDGAMGKVARAPRARATIKTADTADTTKTAKSAKSTSGGGT